MARLGPLFGPSNCPEKVYVYVPLLRSFPGNEAHKLFLGVQNGVFWVGTKKFMLRRFMCCFRPLMAACAPSHVEVVPATAATSVVVAAIAEAYMSWGIPSLTSFV